jgi:prophage antirepressor-like protein
MNKLQIFKNDTFEVRAILEDGTVLFDAETVARCLGFTQTQNKNGKLYTSTRWETINAHLENHFPIKLGKGDMIPEPMVYKLAFKASNETAEKFQDWLAIDVIPQIRKTGNYMPDASDLSPHLQLMNALVAQMNQEALSRQKLQSQVEETRELLEVAKEEIQEMREVVELKPFDNWRETTNSLINKICQKTGDYKDTRHKIYDALNTRARVDIKRRLENMRARMVYAGSSKSKADGLTYLDVIAEDKKLIEIYTAIVKEMAIKKGVN